MSIDSAESISVQAAGFFLKIVARCAEKAAILTAAA
jgi:hypothetical protein